MKSDAPRVAILFFAMILVSLARQARAEMWCGDGPGTKLSHPCTDDDDDPAVSAAIDKYQEQWMNLPGVSLVDHNDTYHNRAQSIVVDVDGAFVDSVKKQIPASVDGIPVMIVPFKKTDKDDEAGHYAYGPPGYGPHAYGSNADVPPTDPAELARRAAQQAEQEKAQESYNSIIRQYAERWYDLPGVVGVNAKCDDDCTAIEISVQRELLSQARDEIPSSVNGVPIVLTPDD
jgi:hypothetical protein